MVRQLKVVVIGAGIAGLGATIAFARAGHAVTLVERDAAPPPPLPDQSFLDWARPGVPQRRLVHGFLPLARKVLRENAPDLVERLFEAGAHDVDLLEPLQGRSVEEGDEELYALRCRRTVFEWVLRTQLEAEQSVTVLSGAQVSGLDARRLSNGERPAVTGVRLRSGEVLPATLVVDAAGRQSESPAWLAAVGARPPLEQSQDCKLVYYTRFYERPDDHFPVAHQANLGYAYVSAVAADGRTFSLTFFVRAEESELRTLRHDDRFERAVAAVPGFGAWRAGATPIGPVSAMGALQNRFRNFRPEGRPSVTGLIPIGDSLSHTNPTLGRGMSLALDHGFRAAGLPWGDASLDECATRYHDQVDAKAEASYRDAVDQDRAGEGLYRGDPELASNPRVLLTLARPLAAIHDHHLYRAAVRNNGLLTPPGAFISEPWIGRARRLFEGRTLGRPDGVGPSREELLGLLQG